MLPEIRITIERTGQRTYRSRATNLLLDNLIVVLQSRALSGIIWSRVGHLIRLGISTHGGRDCEHSRSPLRANRH